MKEAAIWILVIYSLANAGIIYYFFIYKSREADREYQRKLKDIYK
jgi:hypothetical protein